jgi:hypothetical protein
MMKRHSEELNRESRWSVSSLEDVRVLLQSELDKFVPLFSRDAPNPLISIDRDLRASCRLSLLVNIDAERTIQHHDQFLVLHASECSPAHRSLARNAYVARILMQGEPAFVYIGAVRLGRNPLLSEAMQSGQLLVLACSKSLRDEPRALGFPWPVKVHRPLNVVSALGYLERMGATVAGPAGEGSVHLLRAVLDTTLKVRSEPATREWTRADETWGLAGFSHVVYAFCSPSLSLHLPVFSLLVPL